MLSRATVCYMTPQWTVGDRLAKARREAGISRAQMARELEVDPGTITRWERATDVPRRTIIAYSALCDVPVDWLEGELVGVTRQYELAA